MRTGEEGFGGFESKEEILVQEPEGHGLALLDRNVTPF